MCRAGHYDSPVESYPHAFQRLEVSGLVVQARRGIDDHSRRQRTGRILGRQDEALIIDLREPEELRHLAADGYMLPDGNVGARLASKKDGYSVRGGRVAVGRFRQVLDKERVVNIPARVLILIAAGDNTTKVDEAVEIGRFRPNPLYRPNREKWSLSGRQQGVQEQDDEDCR